MVSRAKTKYAKVEFDKEPGGGRCLRELGVLGAIIFLKLVLFKNSVKYLRA